MRSTLLTGIQADILAAPISRRAITVIAVLSALLLLGMLAYPFGYDQAAFMDGGEMILHGGAVPYRDFIDTKPPVIFYLYALSALLFGHHQWSIRLLDVLLTGGALYYFYNIIKRHTSSERLAITSVLITAVYHTAIGFWMTAQAETFALLPSLYLFDRTLRAARGERTSVLAIALCSVAAASLVLLKFTFISLPVTAWLFALYYKKKRAIPFVLGNAVGMSVLLALYLFHLHVVGGLERFEESLQWVRSYAALEPIFNADTIGKTFYYLFPSRLLNVVSPFGFLLAAFGVAYVARTPKEWPERQFFTLALAVTATHLLLVLYERKCFQYHYARTLWAIAPFVAIGLLTVYTYYKQWIAGEHSIINRMVCIVVAAVAFFFSPMVQVFSQPVRWTFDALRGADITTLAQQRLPEYFSGEQELAGNYLKQKLGASDQIFFWGNDVGVYFFADRLPQTICLTNTPFVTTWTPPQWWSALLSQLQSKPPAAIVVERGDARPYISGEQRDSYELLAQFPQLQSFIASGYASDTTIGHFVIYRRTVQ